MAKACYMTINVKLAYLLAKTFRLPLWCVRIQISTVIQSFRHNISAQVILPLPRPFATPCLSSVIRLSALLYVDGNCVYRPCSTFVVLRHKRHASCVRSLGHGHTDADTTAAATVTSQWLSSTARAAPHFLTVVRPAGEPPISPTSRS